MSVISSTSSLSYEEFFRYLNNNLESLCKEAHKSIYKEELDRIVCWNISDTVHYLLAKNTNPIVNYKSIGYAEDTNLLMNKYLSDKYLLTIAYDGEVHSLDTIVMRTMTNHSFLVELSSIINGRKADYFYGHKFETPSELWIEIYNRSKMLGE